MPKEHINDQVDPDHRRAIVSWGRDAPYVQLGVEFPQARQRFLSGGQTSPGESADTPAPGEDAETHTGLFMQLDRDGLNLMIRTLRRARDQAFGADA